MRKFLLALALAFVAIFANVQVVSAETEFKLNQDFDSITSGVPTGWNNSEGTTSVADYRWSSYATGHSGRCLRFNSYNNYSGNDNYLKTPVLNLSQGSWLLKFWYKNPSGGNFEVYLSTDGGTTRTLLKDNLTGVANWTYEEISLTAAANGSDSVVIIFRGVSNYGSGDAYIFLDDVIVESAPDCKAPNAIIVSNLTTTSATIGWGLGDGIADPATYIYSLKTADGTVVESNPALPAPVGLTYNISGLTANTTYVVELQGDCNSSYAGLSNIATAIFTTLCYPQSAPYYNDFDALTSLPECTFSANASISQGGRSGNCIALNTTAAEDAYIVFPELTLRSDTVQATFWFKTSSVSGGNTPLQIGIVTDPSDVGTSFEAFYIGELTNTTWTEIRINTRLTEQPLTNSTMIAVSVPKAYVRTTFVDDASIIAIPTCIRPENFTLSNITSSSVNLAWNTTNANAVRVKIMSANDTTYQIATTNPYTVNGLTPNTEYSFRICGLCSATDSSEYNPYTLKAKTACVVATTPIFSQTFDNLSGASIPDCWTQDWLYKPSDNMKSVPFARTTDAAHSGTYSMSLVDQQSGSISYLSTQCIPINQAGQYTLSVWVYRQDAPSYSTEGLKFWVSPDFNDTANATLLGYVHRHYQATPAEASYNEWYNYEYIINTTGNQYILIEGISNYGAATYFDDVEVKLTPSCMKVKNVSLATPTASDVNVVWEAGKDETQWIVNYRLVRGATTIETVTDTVSAPTINVDGLFPATTYNLVGSVKAYCGGSDVADSVKFNFTFVSACDALTTLPYTCGFESVEISSINNPLPFCWARYNDAPAENYYPYAYNTSYSRTGSNCLYFYPVTSSYSDYGDNQVAILPEINTTVLPMNTLRTIFYARLASSSSTGVKIIVGAMTDPDDLSTFVAVDSVTITGTEYVKCDYNFANYTGAGTYMALRVPRAAGYNSLYIDDVKIDYIPTCADIIGAGAIVSDITANSAKITPSDQSAINWSYGYGTTGTPFALLTIADTTGGSVVLNGLQAQTKYDVYVRRICGTEYGAWSDVATFKTACAATNPPYFDDFEDYLVDSLTGCYAVTNSSYYFLKVHSSSATATGNSQVNHTTGGTKGVCISSEYTTPYDGDGTYRALAYIHLEAGKNYELSVYAKAGDGWNGTLDWNLTFQLGSSINTLSNLITHSVASTDWARYSSYISVSATGDYYVGLSSSAGNASNYYYVFFDDLSLEEVACIPPTGTFVNNLTSSSASVTLTSTSSSWQVAVSSTPIDITGTVTGDIMFDTITTPSFIVNSLSANTEYYYTIRSICDQGGYSAWMKPSSFRTQCTAFELPYVEGFEAMNSTLCWSALGGTGTISRTNVANTGSGAMLASAATAVSPELNVTTLAPYSVTGWARAAVDSASFTILVGNDPSNTTSFQDLQTVMIPRANDWVEFTCNFNILNDPDYSQWQNARYIAFGAGNQNIIYDDIMVDITSTCPKPSSGTITNITAHSATIGWTESGTATSWIVEAVSSAGATSTFSATTNPINITGLNAATGYTVYVKAICSTSDTSYSYKAGTFTTDCDYVNAPFNETFESFGIDATPTCWDISASTTSTKNASPQYVWGVHSVSGTNAIRMNNYNVQSGTALINTPEIILDATKSYQLRYDYCSQSNGGDLFVKIKRHSDTDFTQIGQHANNGSTDNESIREFLTNVYALDSYVGDTIQIQFFTNANWGYGAIWVDNVKVRELSSCVEPATISASNIGQNMATVTFTDTVATHTAWQYAYGPAGFNVETATPVDITTKTISLTGLNASTTYDVYVRSVCSASDRSPWVSVTFKTTSIPATLPYITDFSDGVQNGAWDVFGAGTNLFMFGTDANAKFPTGNAAMYVSNGGQYTYDNSVTTKTAIARLFYFDEASYSIEFDWKCSGGEGSYDFARFYLAPASVDPLPAGSGSFSYLTWPNGIIALDGDQYRNMTSATQHVSRVIDFTGKPGSYYLVFVWVNDYAGGTEDYPLSVGNVSVSELNCQLVTGAKVITAMTTLTSVTATCNNPNPGADVRWAVSTTNSIADTIMSDIAAADTFTVTGLNPSTQYYMFFRAECSETSTSPWIYVPFTSGCGTITNYPYVQDFEADAFTPACWGNVTTAVGVDYNNDPVPGEWERSEYSWTQYGNGQAWAHLYGYNGSAALLITPAFNFEATRDYHLSFLMYHYGSNYYTDQVDVYVGPNPNKTGAVKLASLIAYDEEIPQYQDARLIHDYDIPASMTGGDFYIIFEGTYNASGFVYIDDITVDRYPLCRDLQEDPTFVASTASTVTVSEPMGSKSAMIFGIAPFTTSVTTADITETVVSTTGTATFTGLNANANYAVFARGVCADVEDTTAWTGYVKCTTKADDCFTPDGVHAVGNICDTAAVIAWNPVPDAQEYQCELSTPLAPAQTFTLYESNIIAINTLNSNTLYGFKVRAICGAGDTTDYSSSYLFKTLTTPAQIPYVTGFETTDDNALWSRVTSAELNNFVFGSNTGGVSSGTQGLYISNNGSTYAQTVPQIQGYSYDDVYNVAYATRTVYFPAAGNYDITFDWKSDPSLPGAYGNYYNAFGRAYLAPTDALLTSDDPQYQRKAPAGSIVLGSDLNGSRTWQTSSSIVNISEPCYRNVVFMWFAQNMYGYADASEGSAYPLAIDNLSVTEVSCLPTTALTTIGVSDTYGSVVVDKAEPVDINYTILTVNSVDSIQTYSTFASSGLTDTLTFTGLNPSTQYYVFVRTVCDSADFGSWRKVAMLTTAVPASLPYVCDFENTTENSNWVCPLAGTNHFIVGSGASNGGNNSIYITDDNASNNYNLTANTDATYATRIFYLPEGLYEYSLDWRANGESTFDYGRIFMLPASVSVVEGTMLAGLSTSTVPYGAIAIDGGTRLNQVTDFQSISDTFRITTPGSYNMVLFWHNDYGGGTNPPLAVDNITLKAVTCLPPSASVITSATTETSITAVIKNNSENSSIVYGASATGNFNDAIAIDTIPYNADRDTVVLNGLSASSNYQLMVRSLCDEGDESLWNRTKFKTLCGEITSFPYTEGFEALGTSYQQGLAENICWNSLNDANSYPTYHGSTSSPYEGQKCLQMHSSSTADLYLALPQMADINNMNLSFVMKSETTDSYTGIIYAGYMTDVDDASTFVPLLTTARSTSWVSQSVVITNAPAGARIAFKYGSPGCAQNNYGWLDDIRVSELVPGPTYYDTVCHNKPYNLHGFSKAASTMHDGDNTFTRVRTATVAGEKDTLYTAYVYMRTAISATSYDTICAGQPYVKGLWNIAKPITRRYYQTFQGASACGCDSTVELYLTVIPTTYVYSDTICNGDSYVFGDTIITDPGMYVRSYTSLLGCTNTDTLYLMVMPDSIFDVAAVCEVELPYVWRGQNITTPGRHYKSITGLHGCAQTAVLDLTVYKNDSTVFVAFCQGGFARVRDTIITTAGNYTLVRLNEHQCYVTYNITATVTAPAPENVYDNACEGYLYTGYGINNLYVDADTIVVVNTKTIDAKCDSVAIVHLTFVETKYSEFTANIVQGEVYRWNGEDFTEEDDYVRTFQSAVGCDSIVTLHLRYKGAGVENVTNFNVNIVPNPVNAGQTSFVHGNFTGVKNVEILNSFGQVIDTFVPDSYPIEVKGIQASGIYFVRITNEDDKVAIEKLVVK